MDSLITKEELENEIEKIEQTFLKKIVVCQEVISFCRKILEEYRKEIHSNGFANKSLEIWFFKEQKQIPLTALIFYSYLQEYFLNSPKGGQEFQRNYINTKIKKANKFFLSNSEFRQYVELAENYLDVFYFTREYNSNTVSGSKLYFLDPEFSTSHDLILGELNANLLFVKFLKQQLKSLDYSLREATGEIKGLQWTESKAGLVELIYALHEQKAFNGGKAGLKEIANFFRNVYPLENADMYRTFPELKSRKKSKTQFLDELSINLLTKMRET